MSLSSMTSARLRASHYFPGERNACMAISAIILCNSKGVTSSVVLRQSNCSLDVFNGVARQFYSANRRTSLLFKSLIQSDHPSMTLPLLSVRSAKLTKYPTCFLWATICPLHHPQYFLTSPDLSLSSYSTSIKRLIKALPFGFLLLLNICLRLSGPSSPHLP